MSGGGGGSSGGFVFSGKAAVMKLEDIISSSDGGAPPGGLSVEQELEAVKKELFETKQELFEATENLHEMQQLYESRIGRGGDAHFVRKQLLSEEAEWAREKSELQTEVSRLRQRLATAEEDLARGSAAAGVGSGGTEGGRGGAGGEKTAEEALEGFAADILGSKPDFDSAACLEGYRTVFSWCTAPWASAPLKHTIVRGARALARGDGDMKQTLVFCGAHTAMVDVTEKEVAAGASQSGGGSRRASSAPRGPAGHPHQASSPRIGHLQGSLDASAVGGPAHQSPGRSLVSPGRGLVSPGPGGVASGVSDGVEDVSVAGAGGGVGSSLLEEAVACLSNLACKHKPSRTAIAEAGGVRALLATVRHSGDAGAQVKACAALSNLACSATVKVHIGNEGGGEVLVRALAGAQGDEDLQLEACRALRNLASQSEANCQKIAVGGGVDALGAACEASAHAGVVAQAVAALSNLAREGSTRSEMRHKLGWDAEWGTRQLAAMARRAARAQREASQSAAASARGVSRCASWTSRARAYRPASPPQRSPRDVDADMVLASLERSLTGAHSPFHPRVRASAGRPGGGGGGRGAQV